jgi:hypothetical protein
MSGDPPVTNPQPPRKLTPEAERAIAEAAKRRAEFKMPKPAQEVGGPKGLEPTRYGDLEKKGLTSDF